MNRPSDSRASVAACMARPCGVHIRGAGTTEIPVRSVVSCDQAEQTWNESGTVPAAAAVISGVEDALRDYGVRIDEAPISPFRLFELIKAAKAAGGVTRENVSKQIGSLDYKGITTTIKFQANGELEEAGQVINLFTQKGGKIVVVGDIRDQN